MLKVLGFFNFFLIQFFFLRLYTFEGNCGELSGLGVMGPVLPFTGWFGRPYFPGKKYRKRLEIVKSTLV